MFPAPLWRAGAGLVRRRSPTAEPDPGTMISTFITRSRVLRLATCCLQRVACGLVPRHQSDWRRKAQFSV